MTNETLIILALLVPTLGAVLIWLTDWNSNVRETTTLATAGLLFAIVLAILHRFMNGEQLATGSIQIVPGLELGFSVEPLGMLFACIASGLWIVNSIYSIGYMRGNKEPRQTPFYICFAIALASTMGIAFAANLFTLFLFYEILTFSTYPLVTHKADESAKEGGRVYLLILVGTSTVLLLPAIIATALIAGTLDFAPGGILAGKANDTTVMILFAMFMFGIGKAALMPFHKWLPAAMVAPTPVSALLHAVAVVKAGVFSIVKVVVYVFGVEALALSGVAWWLLYAAGATILIASIVALKADNLKRRLAYSTVSQLSYVILAAAILAPISVIGAAMHIAAHAVSKITLFFAAGSIYTAAHLTEVSQLNGIGRRMPWTMGAFAIGALSMIGVPPTAGFLSKWYILLGAMDTQQWIAVGVIIISTLLNAAYFLPIVYAAFFRAPDGKSKDHGEAPLPVVLAVTATAAATVVLFFFPGVPLALSEMLAVIGVGGG